MPRLRPVVSRKRMLLFRLNRSAQEIEDHDESRTQYDGLEKAADIQIKLYCRTFAVSSHHFHMALMIFWWKVDVTVLMLGPFLNQAFSVF